MIKKKDSKVSVVVLADKNATDFTNTVNSVVQQSLNEIQIIILENNCQNEMDEKDSRIQIIHQDFDDWAKIKNKALNQIKSPYVIFLKSGDVLKKTALEKLYQSAKASNSDIVFCDYTKKTGRINFLLSQEVFDPADHLTALFDIAKESSNLFYKTNFLISNNFRFRSPLLVDDFWLLTTLFNSKELCYYKEDMLFCSQKEEEDLSSQTSNLVGLYTNLYRNISLRCSSEVRLLEFVLSRLKFFSSFVLEPLKTKFLLDVYNDFNPYVENFQNSLGDLSSDLKEWFDSLRFKQVVYGELEKDFWSLKENFPVVLTAYTADDMLRCGVVIQSIISLKDKKKFYDVYILCADKIDKQDILMLEAMSKNKVRVACVFISSILQFKQNYAKLNPSLRYSVTLIPSFLSLYEKVLFVGNNSLFIQDISSLYSLNLEDNLVAAIPVTDPKLCNEQKLKILNEDYIDTDFILFNVSAWKENATFERFIKFLDVGKKEDITTIQDLLNVILYGKISFLEHLWNMPYSYLMKQCLVKISEIKLLKYDSLLPVKNPSLFLMDRWWENARKCPFYSKFLLSAVPPCPAPAPVKAVPAKAVAAKVAPLEKANAKGTVFPAAMETLRKEYIINAILSVFSFGEKRKMYRNKLNEIANMMHAGS